MVNKFQSVNKLEWIWLFDLEKPYEIYSNLKKPWNISLAGVTFLF